MTHDQIPYRFLEFPYPGSYCDISKKESANAFSLLMSQRDERVANFLAYTKLILCVELSLHSPFEDLDELPKRISSKGEREPVNSLDYAKMLDALPEGRREFIRGVLPKWEPNLTTLEIGFDAGVVWGEIFITKYQNCRWAVGGHGKRSIDFQQPVIVGPERHGMEFNPIREFQTFLRGIASNSPDHRTISSVSSSWSVLLKAK